MTDTPIRAPDKASDTRRLRAYDASEIANSAEAGRGRGLGELSIRPPTTSEMVRRAFREFLGLPLALSLGAVAAAIFISLLDHSPPDFVTAPRDWLANNLFTDEDQTLAILELFSGAMFTVVTFTFSTLLIALQQTGGSMGVQVVNGFISRRRNQVLLGFLLGAALFVALTRALSGGGIVPVLGSFASLVVASLAILTLAALFFMTTNQSRPSFVVDNLRARILQSRRSTHEMLLKTRRVSAIPDTPSRKVLARDHGYIADIDVEALSRLAERPGTEIELVCEIGDYMVHGDPVALVRGFDRDVSGDIVDALTMDSQRSLEHDPTSGLTNLFAMSWRTGSAALQNQETTVNAINAVSDVLTHWLHDAPFLLNDDPEWNVVYPDTALLQLVDGMERQLVVAANSAQCYVTAQIYGIVARTFADMPAEVADRACDMVVRSLPSLSAQVMTYNLENSMSRLADTLRDNNRAVVAAKIDARLEELVSKFP